MKTAEEKILEITEKINRQIIENISCNEVLNDCSWGAQVGVLITTNDAEELLKYASLKEDKWISVKKRLPEKRQNILVCFTNSFGSHVSEAEFQYGKFTEPYYGQEISDNFENVTHWQPLPSPPKTENK